SDGSQYVDVEVVFQQATSNTGPAPGVAPIPSDPAAVGLILAGINNVHDAEAWCYNRINANLNKLVPFWYQTRRNQRCIDSEYKKIFANLMRDNAYYAMFQDLPIAERNRQDEHRDQVEFMNAFFFGERISDNQTLDLWKNLEQINSVPATTVDPGVGAKLMAYRANMVGVLPQLKACGQLIDAAEQDFSIAILLETHLFDLYRNRQSYGKNTSQIDLYTDSTTADQIMTAFIAYSNAKMGGLLQICICEGEAEIGSPYRRFKLYKPNGVSLNVITDPFFDDLAAASAPSYYGKYMMILDLGSGGTIYPAVLATNRKNYTSGQIEELARVDKTYACVMEAPTIERTLTSETTTAIVECPKNSLVITNFKSVIKTP